MANRVSVVKDNVKQVFASINELVGKQVLVGIPDTGAERKDDEGANNAVIGYTMEFGSPSQNIPARAHLIPGVQKAEPQALRQMRAAASATMDGDSKKADQFLNAAGMIASNEVRGMINDNIPPALSPNTIRNRHRQRGTKSMRESEQVYLNLVSKGVTPEAAQGETGIIALLNTGEYRNSITYVVRKK
jgi:hypothetical protein